MPNSVRNPLASAMGSFKVTCDATTLSTALHLLAPLASSPGQGTGAVHGLTLLRADDDGRLRCGAATLDQGLLCTIAADVHSRGAIAVPGAALAHFVREAPKGQISLILDDDRFIVKCAQARLSLKTASPDLLAKLPEPSAPVYTGQTGPLGRLLQLTRFAAASDITRPTGGILLTITNAMIALTTTNGFHLAQAWASNPPAPSNGSHNIALNLILPRRSAATLHGLLQATAPDTDVALSLTDERLIAVTPDWRYHTGLLRGPYPDVSAVFPAGARETCDIERQPLLKALTQTAIVSGGREGVQLDFAVDTLTIRSANPDNSVCYACISLPAVWPCAPQTVRLNERLLGNALGAIEDERVQIALHDPRKPLLVTSHVTPHWRYLLMPIAPHTCS